jgi:hypothetical protein
MIENVYGGDPPVATKVSEPLTTTLTVEGEIARAPGNVTVTVAVLVRPSLSVTRTVVISGVLGAVNSPVTAVILPVPDTIEKAYGSVPPVAEKKTVPSGATVTSDGTMVRGSMSE